MVFIEILKGTPVCFDRFCRQIYNTLFQNRALKCRANVGGAFSRWDRHKNRSADMKVLRENFLLEVLKRFWKGTGIL